MSLVLSAIAFSVVGASAQPSLSSSLTSGIAMTSGASSLMTHLQVPELGDFDFLQSVVRLVDRERARGRGKWSGWMATDWLRLHVAELGVSHRGGQIFATAILSQQWLSPTLATEVGYFSGGDAFSRVRVLTKSPYFDPGLIRGFAYDYQAAYAGLEWGSQNFALSASVGVTRVENTYQSIPGAAAGAFNPQAAVQSIRSGDIGPAAKLALLIRM